jgi:Uma2 family endonuclease
MHTETLVPVEEYLKTAYRPDCDYVDGRLVERNVGENDHSFIQKRLLLFLSRMESSLGIYTIQEQRVQISPTRFRVPDLCVMAGGRPSEAIFRTPPLICIEVLSPEDRAGRLQERIEDYLGFGVREVWVIDPQGRRAWAHTAEGSRPVKDGVLRLEKQRNTSEIVVPLSEIFD